MAIVLKPKKSETASSVPTTSDLAVGEICMNVADQKIYTRKSDNSIVIVGSHIATDVTGTSVGGDLTGTVGNAQIAANAVDGTHIALGSDAAGDVMYYNGTNYVRLAKGSNGEVLTLASGVPSWAADSTNVGGTSVGGDLTGTVSNAQIGSNTIGIAELNVSDGSNLQVLTTNGAGTLSWTSKTDATLGANSVGITELDVSDGSAGQMLSTNGSGTLSFASVSIAANSINGTHIALGSDAAGDVMYYNGTNYVRLAKGSNGEVLTLASGVPSWAADSTNVGGTSVGGDVTGTVGNIQIAANAVDGTHIALGSDAAGDIMYYNGTNYIRLAKGTAGQVLTVNSGATAPEWAADSTNVTGTSVGGDVTGTVGNIQIATNTVGISELNVSDGSNGQVLKTNGSGTLSFTTPGVSEATATSKAVTMAIALG